MSLTLLSSGSEYNLLSVRATMEDSLLMLTLLSTHPLARSRYSLNTLDTPPLCSLEGRVGAW